MNYKSKLLSIFLSAGILLNSTSMAFAGQDSVGTVSDNHHTRNENHAELVLNNDLRVDYSGGHLIAKGYELPAEQRNYKGTDKISWTYDGTTLHIKGNGQKMRNFDNLYRRELHTADVYPDWEKYVDPLKIKKIVIEGITNIGDWAFYGYENLTLLELPERLESIGDYAFACSKKLTTLKIPKTIKKIGEFAFFASGLTSLELPEGLKTIGGKAFAQCFDLKAVNIPGSVDVIGEEAFAECDIVSLKLSHGIKHIGKHAFIWNPRLETIQIPNSVDKIGTEAFKYSCSTCIVLPKKFRDQIRDILGNTEYNKGLKIEYTE